MKFLGLVLKISSEAFQYGRSATSPSPRMTVWNVTVADLNPHLQLLCRKNHPSYSSLEIWDVWSSGILENSHRLFGVFERDSWWALSFMSFSPFPRLPCSYCGHVAQFCPADYGGKGYMLPPNLGHEVSHVKLSIF